MNGLLSPDDMMMAGAQGTPSFDEEAYLNSLYGMGDYANAGMFLPYAITPQGERVLSFPAPLQSVARSAARGMGAVSIRQKASRTIGATSILNGGDIIVRSIANGAHLTLSAFASFGTSRG